MGDYFPARLTLTSTCYVAFKQTFHLAPLGIVKLTEHGRIGGYGEGHETVS